MEYHITWNISSCRDIIVHSLEGTATFIRNKWYE